LNRTRIEYLHYTLNVLVGCYGVGCAVRSNCWAFWQAKRKKHYCNLCYQFIPHIHRERLSEPLKVKKPSRIGLNFMGDTFDSAVHPDWQQDLLEMIEKCPQHTFIIFTKQPQNIPKWFDIEAPSNLWVLVSVNRKQDLWRIQTLQDKSFSVLGISAEPLYEDLGEIHLEKIRWLIIGAQTRPNLKPKLEWVKSLCYQANNLGIPIFLKNNLLSSEERLDLMSLFPTQAYPTEV